VRSMAGANAVAVRRMATAGEPEPSDSHLRVAARAAEPHRAESDAAADWAANASDVASAATGGAGRVPVSQPSLRRIPARCSISAVARSRDAVRASERTSAIARVSSPWSSVAVR
jgi:hypothetical protein